MRSAAILAVAAESPLGSGHSAYGVGPPGAVPASAVREDERLRRAGLAKPFVARVAAELDPSLDPATALVERTASSLAAELDRLLPGWRALRIGVAIGTSSGGLVSATECFEVRGRGDALPASLARRAPYFAPLSGLSALGVKPALVVQVLGACSSSGVALGLASRWLDLGYVDLALAGGYDAVSTLVAAGFESLGATTGRVPAPFRANRDGLALGEASVLFALAPASVRLSGGAAPVGYLAGYAASSDAVHVTAPDPEGRGLAEAARAAIADAGLEPSAVDLVSAHATATPLNDAAEARALRAVLGERSETVGVHPFKGVVGHTLGASAALELAAALDAMQAGVVPGAAGEGDLDADVNLRLVGANEARKTSVCLKLSAAFGGANAALVASASPRDGRVTAPSPVSVASVGEPRRAEDLPALKGRVAIADVHLARVDPLSAAAIAAAASALDRLPALPRERTAVVVGTIAATLESGDAFDARRRARGARAVEPRKFIPTTPNLPSGQCCIAFGFRGPAFGVGAGPGAPIEAMLVAHDLVAAGDADHVVVVAAEHVGAVVADVWAAADWPEPEGGACAVVLSRKGHAPVDRAVLLEALTEADACGGRLGGGAPGWPALRELVARLTP